MEFPKRLYINITQENIDNGVCDDPNKCAGALAVKEKLPDYNGIKPIVGISSGKCYIEYFAGYETVLSTRYKISKKLEDFISSFDYDKKTVKPGRFVLTLNPWK